MFTLPDEQKGPDKLFFFFLAPANITLCPTHSHCVLTPSYSCSQADLLLKKSMINERKCAFYIKTQLNRFVYLSPTSVP
jgi:hypothetical protein